MSKRIVARTGAPAKRDVPPDFFGEQRTREEWLDEFGRRRGDAEACIALAVEALVELRIVETYAEAVQLVMSHLDKFVRRAFLDDDDEEGSE